MGGKFEKVSRSIVLHRNGAMRSHFPFSVASDIMEAAEHFAAAVPPRLRRCLTVPVWPT